MRIRCVAVAFALAAIARSLQGAADEPRVRPTASLRTVEGEVSALSELPGEGELAVLAVDLEIAEGNAPLRILLAPREVLEEIDFPIEVGDRVRVRIFASEEAPAFAQRILNTTRGSLVRLRTLRQEPLWNADGAWRGGNPSGGPGWGPGGRHGHGGNREPSGGPPG